MADPVPVPDSRDFEAIAAGAQFRDRIAIRVKASPESIFAALEDVTLADMKLAWLLGEMRYLPSRLSGHMPPVDLHRPFLSALRDSGTLILYDAAPREIITGSAAQLHRIRDQAPVSFQDRASFDSFNDPEHEKLFMSFRVAPAGPAGEHWLVLEHATRALSASSARKFARYWRVIKPAGAIVSRELLRAVGRRARDEGTRATAFE